MFLLLNLIKIFLFFALRFPTFFGLQFYVLKWLGKPRSVLTFTSSSFLKGF